MGSNEFAQSGIGNDDDLESITKIDFFGKKNLKIKKIVCGGYLNAFNLFLTGCFYYLIFNYI
jgi:hypothetical protein